MKTNYLIDHKYKKIGWVLFLIGTGNLVFERITGESLYSFFPLNVSLPNFNSEHELFDWMDVNLEFTITLVIPVIGSLVLLLSKERVEDEFVENMRLNSIFWALLYSNLIFISSTLLLYGLVYLDFLAYYAFLPQILYLIRFHYLLYKNSFLNN